MSKRITFLAAGILAIHGFAGAQNNMSSGIAYSGIKLPVVEGHIYANVRGKGLTTDKVSGNIAAMLGLSTSHSFMKVAETKDQLGISHTDYQQYYKNVKVEGGLVMIHSKDGIVNSINGNIAPLGTLTVTPSVSTELALSNAVKASLVTRQTRQYPAELLITRLPDEKNKTYALAWKVRIDGYDANKKMKMVNIFVDAATGKILNTVSLIAHADVTGTANTLYSGARALTIDSTAQGFRLRDSSRNIKTYNGSGIAIESLATDSFNMDYIHNSRSWGLFTTFTQSKLQTGSDSLIVPNNFNFMSFNIYKGSNSQPVSGERWLFLSSPADLPKVSGFNTIVNPQESYFGAYIAMDSTFSPRYIAQYPLSNLNPGIHNWNDGRGNTGTYTISMNQNPAVDVHWGMQKTHDFYKNFFNRDSYDGLGSVMKNYVDAGSANNAGAYPAPYNFMVYGMGDGSFMGPVVALDVIGHEFTHQVTANNGHGGLNYQGESGALNESFSDIFGKSIEFYAKGSGANWAIGEGVILTAPGFIRSMSQPKLAMNPDTYQGQYWVDPSNVSDTNDYGGVHTNSGVQNKWYYLLVQGGSGSNDKGNVYNVNGIGLAKAQKIAYRNLTNYLTAQSGYMDAYEGSLQATLDLYGNDTTSQEYRMVKEAWYAVGIGTKPTTGVNEIVVKENDLKLYPNPATGRVTISSALKERLEAQIINVVGVPVMNITVTKGLNPVDISGLAKGIYMIRYNTGTKGYVQKLSVL